MIECVISRYCIDNLFIIYLFLNRNFIFKRNYSGTFDVSCDTFSNVISLVLKDSENVTLIRLSASDGLEKCSSKCVSLIHVGES